MTEWIISSCVLIIIIIGIRKVFRKKLDARVLYALWLLVAVRLLVPVSFSESSISIQNLIREDMKSEQMNPAEGELPESGTFITGYSGGNLEDILLSDGDSEAGNHIAGVDGSGLSGSVGGIVGNISSEVELPVVTPVIGESGVLPESSHTLKADVLDNLFACIWLAGSAAGIFLLLGTNLLYRKHVYVSRIRMECEDSHLPVYVSEKVKTPCMFGVMHPAIYLTEDALVEKKTLKYILCHENTHYKHRDNWWTVIRALCVCVHWYNPLVWLAARCSKQDCELACDAETLDQLNGDEKIDYGRVLLDFSIAERSMYDRLQLATSMSGGKKQLKERLQMIVREPKRYVWALVVVVILVGVGIGMTFTGRKTDAEEEVPVNGAVEDKDSNVTEEPKMTTEPEVSQKPGVESTAELAVVPTEIPQGTMGGYMEYTGYMDGCYKYADYESFVNQDYDEDGLTDRVWRENIEKSSMCNYRIEFGNGDVLSVEKIGDGLPNITCGDLDGDGINEILFRAVNWGSTDPNSYGEWAVFKKNGSTYEMLKLPESMADYESDGNGGVLPAYWPMLPLAVEDVGNYQARIYCVGMDGTDDLGKGFSKDVALDVVIDFGEEDWKTIDLDDYITTRSDYLDLDNNGNIYSAEILEEGIPMLRTYTSLFGKWCSDEIVTTFVLKEGMLQVYGMEYTRSDSLKKNVDLGDDKIYQLNIGITYVPGNKTQKIDYIHLEEAGSVWGVDTVDLQEASTREWGEPQAIWGNEGYAILIEDFNFDGCEDLAVQGWIGAKNIPYYCFLWNPVSRQYEYSALIPNVEVDKESQLVVSATNDGGGQYSTTYYRYDDNNQLHMVRYVEENLSPQAALSKLDLTYYGDDTYALQAVERYNEKTASYEGVRISELSYYAKKALEELYEYSGYRVEQAYFIVYESGIVAFGQTLEDMQKNRHFYSRCFSDLGPLAADIDSMHLATERDVWYSPVIQWNVPEKQGKMSDEEVVRWFFERAPIADDEEINYMEENFEGNFLIETISGNWYEVGYNSEKGLVSSIYGPYPEYPTH